MNEHQKAIARIIAAHTAGNVMNTWDVVNALADFFTQEDCPRCYTGTHDHPVFDRGVFTAASYGQESS